MISADYAEFLAGKAPRALAQGIEPGPMHDALFDYQRDVTAFCIRQGRAALFLDTGLGKSVCIIEWCDQMARASNGYALILTPLAVARQFEREAAKFGYQARVVRGQSEVGPGINVCNYDRLDKLDAAAFGAVALDESSILKNFTGRTTRALIETFADTPFRLCATATPAPNDHMELGNHAEFLGVMRAQEMLSRWFINDTATASQKWRLKKAAVNDFWDWVASWARCAESPDDLGYDGSRFVLPDMITHRHRTFGDSRVVFADLLGDQVSATDIYAVKKETAEARAQIVADIVMESAVCRQNTNRTEEIESPQTRNMPQNTLLGGGLITRQNDIKRTSKTETSEIQKIRPNAKTNISNTDSGSACTTSLPFVSSMTMPAQSAERESLAGAVHSTSIIATKPEKSGASCVTPAMSESPISETTPKTCVEPRTTSKDTKIPAWVLWCDTNAEQSILEEKLSGMAISIRGEMAPEKKEQLHDAWLRGEMPCLITKPSIFGASVNWQHCARMAYVGRTFSYESFYRSVRRCWRFGQTCEVHVHLVVAEGEDQIGRVIDRKAEDHRIMKRAMAAAMKRAKWTGESMRLKYNPDHIGRFPEWLKSFA